MIELKPNHIYLVLQFAARKSENKNSIIIRNYIESSIPHISHISAPEHLVYEYIYKGSMYLVNS